MNKSRVEALLKFCLVAAGQEDYGERRLGSIHLLKYLYLADLAFAEDNNGETYTGTPWRFHHFGPWSYEVFEQIEPIMRATNAREDSFTSSRFERDFKRWSLTDDYLFESLLHELPPEVTQAIKENIREFHDDTAELLHHVYRTRPMRRACPGDMLRFEPEQAISKSDANGFEWSPKIQISKPRRKEIRAQIKRILQDRRQARASSPEAATPRYDEVYVKGMAWFNALEDSELAEFEAEVNIAPDVWTSEARKDDEIS